jgi:fructosamine-3-kinase
MQVPDQVAGWCRSQGLGEIVSQKPVSGGCINQGAVIVTEEGGSFFLKTNANQPPDMFQREAEGLEALRVDQAPRVPEVLQVGETFLLLEDLQPAARGKDYWEVFGRGMAYLHRQTHEAYGFAHDNYLGSTPQVNPWTENGFEFFAEHRLRFQVQLARQAGRIPSRDAGRVEDLAERLERYLPEQPASLIHGDLWAGNAITDQDGQPAVIDPAVHYGWAEADLAMTDLFGSHPDSFYRAYQEVRPLEKGFRDRFPLYNLYHLLNHLNLFGRSYLGRVQAVLDRYR